MDTIFFFFTCAQCCMWYVFFSSSFFHLLFDFYNDPATLLVTGGSHGEALVFSSHPGAHGDCIYRLYCSKK